MTNKSRKHNFLFKGMMFGLAFLMCVSFMPLSALASLADAVMDTTLSSLHQITLSADPDEKVTKGDTYTFGVGQYSYNGKTYVVGNPEKTEQAKDDNFETSDVTVKYKGTSVFEDINITYNKTTNTTTYGTFTPSRTGTYVVSYSVTDKGGNVYSYDYEIECTTSNAHFAFESVEDSAASFLTYDLALLAAKGGEYTDITLPLPNIYDENDKLIKDNKNETVKCYLDANDATDAGVEDYILLTISGGSKDGVKITQDGDKFFVDGDLIKDTTGVGTYIITYTFYQNGKYVVSTDKTFVVSDKYYTDKDGKAGYTLETSWKDSVFSTAVTGVKSKLPVIQGLTSNNDTPKSELVPVTYDIKITHKVDNKYVDVTEKCYSEEDGVRYFTPYADGDYVISYDMTDFYGNHPKEGTAQFSVTGVKDQQLPSVYIYDANPSYAKDGDDYVDAKNKLKTKTPYNNFVIYAIGAKDNAADLKDIELKRIIRTPGGTTVVETTEYADYNLIFQFTNYNELLTYNFALRQDMAKDNITSSSTDEEISQWLKDNHYLIVTNEADKKDIEGYAYINYSHKFEAQATSASAYKVIYEARDPYAKNGNISLSSSRAQQILDINFTELNVRNEIAPVVTGPKNLQSSYAKGDTITFATPSVTSDADKGRTANHYVYRFLDASGNPIKRNAEDETIEFTPVQGENSNTNTTVRPTSDGWYKLVAENSQFTISLDEVPTTAGGVEICLYAIDDDGNIGYWLKRMTIVNTNDTAAPTLHGFESDLATAKNQNDRITLPTLYYSDDRVEFMTADVKVYHIRDGVKQLVPSDGKNYYSNPDAGSFIVEAGSFVAERAGQYQVVVTAIDSANHSVTNFFNVTVNEKTRVEKPSIENISTSTKTIRVGADPEYLPIPVVSIQSNDTFGYIGLDANDKSVKDGYYIVKAESSASNNFKIINNKHFSATTQGVYKLRYYVYLIQYNKASLKENTTGLSNGDLYMKDGNLMLHADQEYYITVNLKEGTLAVNTLRNGFGTEYKGTLTNVSLLPLEPSDVQIFDVQDTENPIVKVDLSGIKSSNNELNQEIILPEIAADIKNAEGIDESKSYVQISIERPSGTTPLVTIYMDKWTDATNEYYKDGNVRYTLSQNGTYTINYVVYDKNGKKGELSKTIYNGDTVKPTIETTDALLNNKTDAYKIGDKLSLLISKETLKLEDKGGATWEELLETLEVKLTNTTTSTEIKNNGDAAAHTYEFNLSSAGTYELILTVKDAAGWKAEKKIEFTIGGTDTTPTVSYQTIGTILIVVSAVILAGVVVYFVVSKVKNDKKEKRK